MSLNFDQIPSLTTELAAFEHLEMYFNQVSSEIFIQNFLILVDNQNSHILKFLNLFLINLSSSKLPAFEHRKF